MNAWVFRHLDELQRIYGAGTPQQTGQGAPTGQVQVLDRAATEADVSACGAQVSQAPVSRDPATAGLETTQVPHGPPQSAPVPAAGSVIRCETEDGPDVILTPAKREHRPRR